MTSRDIGRNAVNGAEYAGSFLERFKAPASYEGEQRDFEEFLRKETDRYQKAYGIKPLLPTRENREISKSFFEKKRTAIRKLMESPRMAIFFITWAVLLMYGESIKRTGFLRCMTV